MDQSEVDVRFTYHTPDEGKIVKHEKIRDTAFDLAVIINEICPECREQSLAITALEEAVMWANAAIARRE